MFVYGNEKIAVVNLAAAGAMITIPGLFSDCNVMANQKVKLSIGKINWSINLNTVIFK